MSEAREHLFGGIHCGLISISALPWELAMIPTRERWRLWEEGGGGCGCGYCR